MELDLVVISKHFYDSQLLGRVKWSLESGVI